MDLIAKNERNGLFQYLVCLKMEWENLRHELVCGFTVFLEQFIVFCSDQQRD